LTSVFEELDDDDLKQCEELAVEWNTKALPDDIQRKYVLYPIAAEQLIMDTKILQNDSDGSNRLPQIYKLSDWGNLHRIRSLYR
jgi:hypothetical protein